MSTQKDISNEIESLGAFRSLVRAYEEIASVRMKRTRESVLKNRAFLAEIEDIFEKVRSSYAREVKEIARKKRQQGKEKITFLSHNGKNVAVLLSANSGLYGSIVQSTFDLFMTEIRETDSEATIVGRQGVNLFQTEAPDHPFTQFEIPDQKLKSGDLDELIKHIVQYEEIHVYYGQFVSVVTQRPEKLTISAEISLEEGEAKVGKQFLFEPSLDKILEFFETQIFGARFEQTARESELAKYASRVLAMDRADENIKERVEALHIKGLKAKHREINRKQLNSLVSMSMWR